MGATLLISDRFWNAPEVLIVGNRAIGTWMRFACYHAQWPDYDIPRGLVKLCRAQKADVELLVEDGWLIETLKGWRLGQQDSGLWTISNGLPAATGVRVPRPPIPTDVRSAVFERDGLACLECGADEDLTLDHIIPFSLGGPDTFENLRVLCRRCNSRKGNRVEVARG